MDLIFNPIILSVLVLCVLCLVKVNVLVALILAAITAGLSGGIDIGKTMTLLADGFSANATTALSYILLGTFAVAIAHTGLMQVLVSWMNKNKKFQKDQLQAEGYTQIEEFYKEGLR